MSYSVELKFVREDDETLEMNKTTDYRIIDITGIEASSYTHNTTSSEEDGANIASTKIEPRPIEITGDIAKNSNEDDNRETLTRFFDPHQSGTMYITRNDVSRKIDYMVDAFVYKTNKIYQFIQFTISLNCIEDPYFSDSSNYSNTITQIMPQFAFPLAILADTGKIMGYRQYDNKMPIVNSGDKETGIEIVITAKRGTMTNITITLNSSEYIKVNVDMEQYDVLIINTNARKKSVTLNGENIINKIDKDSTFFSLKKGKNIFAYECDDGSENIDIETNFYRKFLGV